MKLDRLCIYAGAIILILGACLHASGYPHMSEEIRKQGITFPLSGVARVGWVGFSVELFFLGVIALLAAAHPFGKRIVLAVALCTGVTAALMFHFLHAFIGVYIIALVTLLFLLGFFLKPSPSA